MHNNFALTNKHIENMAESNIPSNILSDDAVRFISKRHNATAEDVMDSYAARFDENTVRHDTPIKLEDNEIQIIHDLITMYDK